MLKCKEIWNLGEQNRNSRENVGENINFKSLKTSHSELPMWQFIFFFLPLSSLPHNHPLFFSLWSVTAHGDFPSSHLPSLHVLALWDGGVSKPEIPRRWLPSSHRRWKRARVGGKPFELQCWLDRQSAPFQLVGGAASLPSSSWPRPNPWRPKIYRKVARARGGMWAATLN